MDVFGLGISTGTFQRHVEVILDMGRDHRSSYVCCVNVHMCMEAQGDTGFAAVVNGADLATADGMPILKSLNHFHRVDQERVAGNDLLPAVMAAAEKAGLSVFFHGGQQEVLDIIVERAAKDFPNLRIAGTWSPPFRPLTPEEQAEEVQRIADSGAHIVMVSLGCPRQERWMAAMKGKVPAVMLGVGGAFLLYAGMDTRAPLWMRKASMEWMYRLALEPRRLWKRYLVTNSAFIWMYAKKVARNWFGGAAR
ncbi:MAG TPA: WecB/TagA/CpsF family glycosyltransferase [Flavobacteriales bacterium]|nr:WecB/TagA/CpsF family glycosyltransferase [Flavobacteriales bacterium]